MAERPKHQKRNIGAKDLGPAVALLRSFGIKPSRIAKLLKESSSNVRQIDHRSQHPKEELPLLMTPQESELEQYASPIYGKERTKLEHLEHEIEAIAHRFASIYKFDEGYRTLRMFLPQLSSPTHPWRMRIKARLHYHLAWFAVHQGLAATALLESEIAQFCYIGAYRQSGEQRDLEGFIDTALIVALALLLSVESNLGKRELQALKVLDLARDVAASAGIDLGSEHYRQQGTLQFRIGDDESARLSFAKAMHKMEEKGEAKNEAHLQMTGKRFLNLTGATPNWEGANELREKVRFAFGPSSLEYAMNCNTSAAAALMTDSPSIHKQALHLLSEVVDTQFGHQASVKKLLSLTPDLKLSEELHKRWIRAALHTNAFRKR